VVRRVFVGLVSLVIAPIAGVVTAGSMPNPPGNGPGIGQVILGVLVPISLSTLVARGVARTKWFEAAVWAFVALIVTGVLVVALIVIVSSIEG
jgi:hypothetical protein